MRIQKNNVIMPKAHFIAEHKRLTKILNAVSNENNKQMKELREFTRRRKPRTFDNSKPNN